MWQYTSYNLPLALSALLSAMVVAYIWGQRRQLGAWPLGVLMLGVALWSLGAALEMAAVTMADKMLWVKVLYIGIVMVPGAWFYFALQYSGRDIGLRTARWLLVEPALVLIIVWNDALHGFYWQQIDLVQESGFSVVSMTQGTGFWLHATYSYVLLLVGLVALVRRYLGAHGPYKKQIGALVAASTVPWLANFIYLFSLSPFPLLDLTPFAFAFTGMISAWALFRFRLFELRPVARDLLIEHMSYGVLVLDDKDRIVDINPAARILLLSESELVGLGVGSVSREIANWLGGGTSAARRTELMLEASGCMCEVALFPLETEGGESRGHLLMLQDISERKRVEAEGSVARQMREQIWGMERGGDIDKVLQSSYAMLQALGVPFAYCGFNVFDPNSASLKFASYQLDAHGQKMDEHTTYDHSNQLISGVWRSGQSLYRPDLHNDDAYDERAVIEEMFSEGIRSVIDVPFSHGTLAANSTQVHAFPPAVVESIKLVADLLSEAFRRRDDIRASERHLTELQHEVDEHRRTAEELLIAKDTAEAATEVKSQFLANMSHEIRTPMNAVLGMTELLLETELDDEQREHLQLVYRSAESLLKLLNDLLEFSRMERHAVLLEDEPFLLRECIEHALATVKPMAQSKSLVLSCDSKDSVAELYKGDAGRLCQVLINLAGNAVKFTNEGTVAVEVAIEESAEAEDVLRFAIADTGVGIEEDKVGEIFGVFTQADASTTRQFGGTGLGLAISKQIVEMMDGKIWVESQVGQGSTFLFTARLGRPEAGFVAAEEVPPSAASPTPPKTVLRVLLVEDMEPNQKVVQSILGRRGHEIVTMNSGSAALVLLGKDRAFDLVLMDLQMPGMSGLEATEIIREEERKNNLPELKIIALTGNALAGDREVCLAAGMDDYLAKPFRSAELLALVETAQEVEVEVDNEHSEVRATLLEGVAGDEDLLRELVDMILEARLHSQKGILSAVESVDAKQLIQTAHAYKSVLGVLGENAAFRAAARLEECARAEDMSDATALFEKLMAAVEQYERTLRSVIGQRS